MNKSVFLSVATVSLTWLTGCSQSPSQTSECSHSANAGIAIIDLDEIARQLGSDKQIVSAIKQREAVLNNKLGQIAKSYTEELNKQKKVIEADSNRDDGSVQLASFEQQANKNFQSARNQAQQNLAQHRSQLINKFREAVRPAARQVARKKGLKVIVTRQDSLQYNYEPECDITSDVVALLKANTVNPSASTPSGSEASNAEANN